MNDKGLSDVGKIALSGKFISRVVVYDLNNADIAKLYLSKLFCGKSLIECSILS